MQSRLDATRLADHRAAALQSAAACAQADLEPAQLERLITAARVGGAPAGVQDWLRTLSEALVQGTGPEPGPSAAPAPAPFRPDALRLASTSLRDALDRFEDRREGRALAAAVAARETDPDATELLGPVVVPVFGYHRLPPDTRAAEARTFDPSALQDHLDADHRWVVATPEGLRELDLSAPGPLTAATLGPVDTEALARARIGAVRVLERAREAAAALASSAPVPLIRTSRPEADGDAAPPSTHRTADSRRRASAPDPRSREAVAARAGGIRRGLERFDASTAGARLRAEASARGPYALPVFGYDPDRPDGRRHGVREAGTGPASRRWLVVTGEGLAEIQGGVARAPWRGQLEPVDAERLADAGFDAESLLGALRALAARVEHGDGPIPWSPSRGRR